MLVGAHSGISGPEGKQHAELRTFLPWHIWLVLAIWEAVIQWQFSGGCAAHALLVTGLKPTGLIFPGHAFLLVLRGFLWASKFFCYLGMHQFVLMIVSLSDSSW